MSLLEPQDDNHPELSKYAKMHDLNVPAQVIRQRMILDQLPPFTIARFFASLSRSPASEEVPETLETPDPSQAASVQVSISQDPRFAKYFHMLKVGLPKDAIRNRLTLAELDPGILEMNPDLPYEAQLPRKEVIEKYKRMLNFGMTLEQIQQKIRLDNVPTPSLILQALSCNSSKSRAPAKKPKLKSTREKKRLFWDTFELPQDPQSKTIWHDLPKSRVISADREHQLYQTFTRKKALKKSPSSSSNSSSSAASSSSVCHVLNTQKAQNLSICLARVKCPFADIKTRLLEFDPKILTSAQIQSLIDSWPSESELKLLKSLSVDIQELQMPEQFVRILIDETPLPIPTIFHCILFKQQFGDHSMSLTTHYADFLAALEILHTSELVAQIFEYCLAFGNCLNGFTRNTMPIAAFDLSCFAKFDQVKAFESSVTLLEVIIRAMEEDLGQNIREKILHLKQILFKAMALCPKQLSADFLELQKKFQLFQSTRRKMTEKGLSIVNQVFEKMVEEKLEALHECEKQVHEESVHVIEYLGQSHREFSFPLFFQDFHQFLTKSLQVLA